MFAEYLGQFDAGVFELVLHLGDVGWIGVCGQRASVLGHGPLPLGYGQLQFAGLLVDLAEMIVDGGVGVDALVGLAEVLFGQGVLARLEVDPAERVEIGAVLRVEFDGLADHGQGLGQMHAAIGEHVAEVVEDGRVLGIDREGLAELSLGLVVELLAVVERAAEEVDVELLVGLRGQRFGGYSAPRRPPASASAACRSEPAPDATRARRVFPW